MSKLQKRKEKRLRDPMHPNVHQVPIALPERSA